jgi:NAD(P)-dependent dehydrogenase (short-subunit alcohol dehydrogenase family)
MHAGVATAGVGGIGAYACRVCARRYASYGAVRRHEAQSHPEAPAEQLSLVPIHATQQIRAVAADFTRRHSRIVSAGSAATMAVATPPADSLLGGSAMPTDYQAQLLEFAKTLLAYPIVEPCTDFATPPTHDDWC